MDFWIEVTSGMRWNRLMREGIALEAPDRTRYRHFFEGVKSGDFVLHYLTTSLTSQKEQRSSVVGVSRVASDPTVVGKKIVARCSDTLKFSKSVSYNELRGHKRKSPSLRRLVGFNMQMYLTQISRSDFESILDVYPANMKRFSRSRLARRLNSI